MKVNLKATFFLVLSFPFFALCTTQDSTKTFEVNLIPGSKENIQFRKDFLLNIVPEKSGWKFSVESSLKKGKNLMVPYLNSMAEDELNKPLVDLIKYQDDADTSLVLPEFFVLAFSSKAPPEDVLAAIQKMRTPELGANELNRAVEIYEMNVSRLWLKMTAMERGMNNKIKSVTYSIDYKKPIVTDSKSSEKIYSDIRTVDFYQVLMPNFEDCYAFYRLSLEEVQYGDFDGDKKEDAFVLGKTCLMGTGGYDVQAVFRLKNGKLEKLVIDENFIWKGKDYSKKMKRGGHGSLAIRDGRLFQVVAIYKENDPNCCPSGGAWEFRYKYNGKSFVIDQAKYVKD